MLRPAHLFFSLFALGAVIGAWLLGKHQSPPLATAPAPVVKAQDSPALAEAQKRIAELTELTRDLESQMKSLRQENSDLIDRLASLGMKNGKGAEPMAATSAEDATPADFVSLGVELMQLRELQEPPAPTIAATLAEVEKLILDHLRRVHPADFGKREGEALAALGLIPEAIDTVAPRAAFLARAIGAWYDEAQGTIRIVDPRTGTPEEPVLSDPALGLSFGILLRNYAKVVLPTNGQPLTLDERMARIGLLGGDAALIRFLRDLKKFQQPNPNELPADDPDHPLNQVPLPAFLRELELFPQVQGFHFAQALHSIAGFQQITAGYGNLPQSTADVIDTERYLNRDRLPVPRIEWRTTEVNKEKPFWDDRLGQSAILTMLKRFNINEVAADAVKGWQSDRLLAWHAKDSIDERGHAVWQTRWISSEAADKFFEAMREWLAQFYDAPIDKIGIAGAVAARSRTIELVRLPDKQSILLIDAADKAFATAAHQVFATP